MIIKTIIITMIIISFTTPDSHFITGVPLLDQGTDPWCGPVSAVMLLQYWNIEASVNEAGESIDPERNGAKVYEITKYLATFELEVYEFNTMDELKEQISRNHPVIVLQWNNDKHERGHYRLVVGYDGTWVYVHDPNGFEDKFTYEEFLDLWIRHNQYALTASPVKSFIHPINGTVRLK